MIPKISSFLINYRFDCVLLLTRNYIFTDTPFSIDEQYFNCRSVDLDRSYAKFMDDYLRMGVAKKRNWLAT
jgi:hypothetical protein